MVLCNFILHLPCLFRKLSAISQFLMFIGSLFSMPIHCTGSHFLHTKKKWFLSVIDVFVFYFFFFQSTIEQWTVVTELLALHNHIQIWVEIDRTREKGPETENDNVLFIAFMNLIILLPFFFLVASFTCFFCVFFCCCFLFWQTFFFLLLGISSYCRVWMITHCYPCWNT